MIEEQLHEALQLVDNSIAAYCHYITPNDVGATGGHQCGFTFAKSFYPMFFDEPGVKGSNKENFIKISWQGDIITQSRAIYYGTSTRDEYRITRFGRGFEFMHDDYVGSLLIMTKDVNAEYKAYVLKEQTNIEDFMATYNLDVSKGNQWIGRNTIVSPNEKVREAFNEFMANANDFPDTSKMAEFARMCICHAYGYSKRDIASQPDAIILKWVDAEYKLFAELEEKIYKPIYTHPFACCQDLVTLSNSILNRRKSRAGKSLEHHLASVFTAAELEYEEQVVTEGNKRPDFIFPNGVSYHDFMFPADKLILLGAKTTCKDRWRQVLNEADRIDNKHLFTLQQGVSKNQLAEMRDEHLTLVVPRANIPLFDRAFHDNILSLSDFIEMVKEKQIK